MFFLSILYACRSLFKIVGPQAKTSLPLLYYTSLHDLVIQSCHMNSSPITALTEISTT